MRGYHCSEGRFRQTPEQVEQRHRLACSKTLLVRQRYMDRILRMAMVYRGYQRNLQEHSAVPFRKMGSSAILVSR